MAKPEDSKLLSTQSWLTIIGFVVSGSLIMGITTSKLDAECEQRKMADISMKELLLTDISYIKKSIERIESLMVGFHATDK